MTTRLVALTIAFFVVTAGAAGAKSKPRTTSSEPRCAIGAISYDDQTGLIAAGGQCVMPAREGRKARKLGAAWNYVWIGYDPENLVVDSSSTGSGRARSFVLNPARFDHVKVTFTLTTPKTRAHPKASASRTQTIETRGNGTAGGKLGSGPTDAPPAVVNGVNPLCPFADPFVESLFGGSIGAQCGTSAVGSGAFVTAPTIDADGTIRAGRWLAPTGECAAPPGVAEGPVQWFGSNVFFVTGYVCAGGLFGQLGLATITLVNPDGSSCTLHPDGFIVGTFRLPPSWGGVARVTFTEVTVDRNTKHTFPFEYETAQLQLPGSENGCTSPNWKIASVQ